MIYIGTNERMPDDYASQQAAKQCRYEMSGLKSGKAAKQQSAPKTPEVENLRLWIRF